MVGIRGCRGSLHSPSPSAPAPPLQPLCYDKRDGAGPVIVRLEGWGYGEGAASLGLERWSKLEGFKLERWDSRVTAELSPMSSAGARSLDH